MLCTWKGKVSSSVEVAVQAERAQGGGGRISADSHMLVCCLHKGLLLRVSGSQKLAGQGVFGSQQGAAHCAGDRQDHEGRFLQG